MKDIFSQAEIDALHDNLVNKQAGNADFAQSLVQIDSYGGAINNNFDPSVTACPQRSSFLKLQYQTYWTDPSNDQAHLKWIRDLFYAVHQEDGFNGTPYPVKNGKPSPKYEGCYINYPDVDMLEGERPNTPGYDWGELYYGKELYQELCATKQKYDPNHIFHHAMSLGAVPNKR